MVSALLRARNCEADGHAARLQPPEFVDDPAVLEHAAVERGRVDLVQPEVTARAAPNSQRTAGAGWVMRGP